MLNSVKMKGKDTIAANLAEAYVTINGNRYNLFQLIDFEARIDKNKVDVKVLGGMMTQSKSVGMSGTFTATMHYNTSIFRELVAEYKDTGRDVYFEIQVTNEDPTSDAGRQTVNFYDCNLDGITLAKFDADGETLDEEIEGTFHNFKMPEKFANLIGML